MPSLDAAAGRKRRLGESLLTTDAAKIAYEHGADQDVFDHCVYDVVASNDEEMAGVHL